MDEKDSDEETIVFDADVARVYREDQGTSHEYPRNLHVTSHISDGPTQEMRPEMFITQEHNNQESTTAASFSSWDNPTKCYPKQNSGLSSCSQPREYHHKLADNTAASSGWPQPQADYRKPSNVSASDNFRPQPINNVQPNQRRLDNHSNEALGWNISAWLTSVTKESINGLLQQPTVEQRDNVSYSARENQRDICVTEERESNLQRPISAYPFIPNTLSNDGSERYHNVEGEGSADSSNPYHSNAFLYNEQQKLPFLTFKNSNNRYNIMKIQKEVIKRTSLGLTEFMKVNENVINKRAWMKVITPRSQSSNDFKSATTSAIPERRSTNNFPEPTVNIPSVKELENILNTVAAKNNYKSLEQTHNKMQNQNVEESCKEDSEIEIIYPGNTSLQDSSSIERERIPSQETTIPPQAQQVNNDYLPAILEQKDETFSEQKLNISPENKVSDIECVYISDSNSHKSSEENVVSVPGQIGKNLSKTKPVKKDNDSMQDTSVVERERVLQQHVRFTSHIPPIDNQDQIDSDFSKTVSDEELEGHSQSLDAEQDRYSRVSSTEREVHHEGLRSPRVTYDRVNNEKSQLPVCKFYVINKCAKGKRCPYSHTSPKRMSTKNIACRYHRSGACTRGTNCWYSHGDVVDMGHSKVDKCKAIPGSSKAVNITLCSNVNTASGNGKASSSNSKGFSNNDKPSSRYDKPSSRYDKPSSRYDKPSSRYDKSSSINDKPSSRYDKPSSRYDEPSSNNDKPSSRYDKPSSNNADASSNNDKPSLKYDKPSSNNDKPSSRYDKPSSNNDDASPSSSDDDDGPEIEHSVGALLNSLRFSTKSSASPATQKVSSKATQQTKVPSKATQQAEVSSKATQQIKVPSKATQQAEVPSKAAQQAEVSSKTTQQAEVSSKATQQAEVSSKATQQAEVPSKATQQAEVSSKTTQQAEVSSKATQQAEVSSKATQQAEVSSKATQQAEVSSKATQQAEVSSKATQQAEVSSKATQQAEVPSKATQQAEVSSKATQQAKVSSKATQQAKVSSKATQQAVPTSEATRQTLIFPSAEANQQTVPPVKGSQNVPAEVIQQTEICLPAKAIQQTVQPIKESEAPVPTATTAVQDVQLSVDVISDIISQLEAFDGEPDLSNKKMEQYSGTNKVKQKKKHFEEQMLTDEKISSVIADTPKSVSPVVIEKLYTATKLGYNETREKEKDSVVNHSRKSLQKPSLQPKSKKGALSHKKLSVSMKCKDQDSSKETKGKCVVADMNSDKTAENSGLLRKNNGASVDTGEERKMNYTHSDSAKVSRTLKSRLDTGAYKSTSANIQQVFSAKDSSKTGIKLKATYKIKPRYNVESDSDDATSLDRETLSSSDTSDNETLNSELLNKNKSINSKDRRLVLNKHCSSTDSKSTASRRSDKKCLRTSDSDESILNSKHRNRPKSESGSDRKMLKNRHQSSIDSQTDDSSTSYSKNQCTRDSEDFNTCVLNNVYHKSNTNRKSVSKHRHGSDKKNKSNCQSISSDENDKSSSVSGKHHLTNSSKNDNSTLKKKHENSIGRKTDNDSDNADIGQPSRRKRKHSKDKRESTKKHRCSSPSNEIGSRREKSESRESKKGTKRRHDAESSKLVSKDNPSGSPTDLYSNKKQKRKDNDLIVSKAKQKEDMHSINEDANMLEHEESSKVCYVIKRTETKMVIGISKDAQPALNLGKETPKVMPYSFHGVRSKDLTQLLTTSGEEKSHGASSVSLSDSQIEEATGLAPISGRHSSLVTSGSCHPNEQLTSSVTSGSGRTHEQLKSSVPSGSGRTHDQLTSSVTSGSGHPHERLTSLVPSGSGHPHERLTSLVPSGSGHPHERLTSPVPSGSGHPHERLTSPVPSGSGHPHERLTSPVPSGSGRPHERRTSPVPSGSGHPHERLTSPVPSGSGRPHERRTSPVPSGSGHPHERLTSPVPSGSGRPHERRTSPVPSGSGRPHERLTNPVPMNIGDRGFGFQHITSAQNNNMKLQKVTRHLLGEYCQPSICNDPYVCLKNCWQRLNLMPWEDPMRSRSFNWELNLRRMIMCLNIPPHLVSKSLIYQTMEEEPNVAKFYDNMREVN
nr:uncharacterized protein LOC123764815 [Procambarus clarkii]XP_045608959.1 uncharacterized protein LOC123764815 [Procambarus clarkii]